MNSRTHSAATPQHMTYCHIEALIQHQLSGRFAVIGLKSCFTLWKVEDKLTLHTSVCSISILLSPIPDVMVNRGRCRWEAFKNLWFFYLTEMLTWHPFLPSWRSGVAMTTGFRLMASLWKTCLYIYIFFFPPTNAPIKKPLPCQKNSCSLTELNGTNKGWWMTVRGMRRIFQRN